MLAASLPQTGREIALELHAVLEQLDPGRFRADTAAAVRERLLAVQARVSSVLDQIEAATSSQALATALERARLVIADAIPTEDDARAAWLALRKRLLAAYDDLRRSLEAWDIHVPRMRPTNYARNAFHVTWGLAAAGTLIAFPSRAVLLPIMTGFLIWSWSMETGRRYLPWLNRWLMSWLGPVAHPHEWHRVNSATWYATALWILAYLDALLPGLIGVLVLTVGDPAAAILGRRFGRTRLPNGRSVEGSLAFIAAAMLLTAPVLALVYPVLPWNEALPTAFAAAVAGAVAEQVSRRIDDNFSIPLSAAAAAAGMLWLLS